MKRILSVLILIAVCFTAFAASSGSYQECVDQTVSLFSSLLGTKTSVAFVGLESDSESFSARFIADVEEGLINSDCVVVNRRDVDKIVAELEFQTSGLVDDKYAASIGHMVGAQMIISGTATNMVSSYRVELSLVDVESSLAKRHISFDIKYDQNLRNILKGDTANIGSQKLAVGARGGVAIEMNKAHEDMVGTNVRPAEKSPISIIGTFAFAYKVLDTVKIQAEVSYIKDNGIDINDMVVVFKDDDDNEIQYITDTVVRYSSVEIPMLLSWNFIQNPISVDVFAGAYVSLPVSAVNLSIDFDAENMDVGASLKGVGIGYGAVAGFDVGINLGPGKFVLDGRFCYDLTVVKATGDILGGVSSVMYRKYIGVTAGYMFEI